MINNLSPKGVLRVRVYGSEGEIKQEVYTHNIITAEGDALIADLLNEVTTRTKIVNANGHIAVGTGWTGTSPKTNTWVNTQVGVSKSMDGGYPQLKSAWGGVDDNVVIYKVTYTPGLLNVNGINEAALTNGAINGAMVDCMAYAEITPSVNMTLSDTLEIVWEISMLGA